jgi:hypothetical protein
MIYFGRVLAKIDPSRKERAVKSIVHGINTLDQLGEKATLAKGYFGLGEFYADTDQRDTALENLKKAEAMFQEMGMDYWLAKARGAMAKLK